MGKRFAPFVKVVLASALLLGIFAVVIAVADAPNKPIEIKGVAKKCLACHSYDKIREATAKYKASSGETVTPHQYVPHKDKKDIPDCTECHAEHSIPPTGKVEKPKDVKFCYEKCHHMEKLTGCSCH